MIAVTINDAQAQARLQRAVAASRNPRALLVNAGREVGRRLKAHFRDKNRNEPNKLGGKRTHFWLEVSRGVQSPVLRNPTTVVVSINHPAIAQKVRGGSIVAKRSQFLTIPVSAEAHGRTAATLAHEKGILLFVLGKKDGQKGVLAELSTTRGIVVHYVLRRSVVQKADPTALPDLKMLANAAADRAEAVLQRQIQGSPPSLT